ncbi:hypothetical protein ACSBR2_022694 [Camellia fascicularis]
MTVTTLTAAISNLHPPQCPQNQMPKCTNIGPSNYQLSFLLTGFALLVIGAGGIRPCNVAFGADQFDQVTESGKRGINIFFNWYYFTFTFSMMVTLTVVVYVQTNVSWAIGLAIPTYLMFISCVLFLVDSFDCGGAGGSGRC